MQISMGKKKLPLLPVRDVVIFPNAIVPISLKREKSVAALERSLNFDKRVFLVMQKNKDVNGPSKEDLYSVGTIGKVIQVQRQPDGVINILVEGDKKAKVEEFSKEVPFFEVLVKEIEETVYSKTQLERMVRPLVEQFRQLITFGKPIPLDVLPSIFDLSNPNQALDLIIFNLDLKSSEKQSLLEQKETK